jgi:hypothetical protein
MSKLWAMGASVGFLNRTDYKLSSQTAVSDWEGPPFLLGYKGVGGVPVAWHKPV